MNCDALQRYLNIFFITRRALYRELKIGRTTLMRAISVGVIPSWSYKVNYGMVSTQYYGEAKAVGMMNAQYFSPSAIAWFYRYAMLMASTDNSIQARALIRGRFIEEYLDMATSDVAFRRAYPHIVNVKTSLLNFADMTWIQHTNGSFGISVQEPSTMMRIIEQQVAVGSLANYTRHGERRCFNRQQKHHLRELIKDYNRVTMPFSPLDYPKSSRKFLVDDVLARLR